MKRIKLSEETYNRVKEKLNEDIDPFYDVKTGFEDFKAAFDQCAVSTSEYNDVNGTRALPPFLEALSKCIDFDAAESVIQKFYNR